MASPQTMVSSMLREQEELRPSVVSRLSGTAFQIAVSAIVLVIVVLVGLAAGRYNVSLPHVVQILASHVFGTSSEASGTEQNVVDLVRMPRILLGLLIGGGLSIAGAALQATFRNPLVSPDIIGVSAGASLGGALALLLGLGSLFLVTGAFAFGLMAIAVLFIVTAGRQRSSTLMVVLGGVVVGSFFTALVGLVTYVANPYTTLPAIVFWLLGSVATATYTKAFIAVVPIAAGTVVLLLLRWRINVLSLGDDEAAALGVRPGALRWTVLCASTLIIAGAVAVSGIVGWVGLVMPHLARMWVGPDHRVLLPVSFLMGAAFLILVDTFARTVTAGEIPLGILTALIGAPAFFILLRRNRDRIWDSA